MQKRARNLAAEELLIEHMENRGWKLFGEIGFELKSPKSP